MTPDNRFAGWTRRERAMVTRGGVQTLRVHALCLTRAGASGYAGRMRMPSARTLERALNVLVVLVLCLVGGFTACALGLSFAFEAPAIARGEHLAALGLTLPACPGCGMCGMSRAFAAFSHGHFSRALAYNAAVVVVWPLFLVMTLACVWGVIQLFRHPLRTHGPLHPHV